MNLAIDKDSNDQNLIDINRLSAILLPSDDIAEDLKQQANELILKEEQEWKLKMQ